MNAWSFKSRKAWQSAAVGLAVMMGCLWFLGQQMQAFDLARMWSTLADITVYQWVLALAATAASFAALGQYDATWHRLLGTGVPSPRAARVGMAAIAIGQALGANAVTSGLARWRGFPDLTVGQVTKLSAGVGISFMLAWAVVAAGLAVWVDLVAVHWAFIVIGVIATLSGLSFLPLTRRKAALAMCAFTVVDLAFAATALWILLPADVAVPWDLAVAAYVLALGLGLISNSPGGVGPFELMLLFLLPQVPAEALVATLLAFRIVYYLIPFVLGAILLARPPAPQHKTSQGPAAWGLSQQSGDIAPCGEGAAHVIRPLGLPVVMGNPLQSTALPRHVLYKSDARWAVRARRAGWHVVHIADEAVIDLTDWSLDGSCKKRLRQGLRRAAARGITTEYATHLPVAEMSSIAAAWSRDHGGELGLTVGRYCPRSLPHQAVFLIRHDGALAGFITCDKGPDDWALDLIRYRPGLPDGAIHVAIHHAIETAGTMGAAHFNLGAAPALTGPLSRWSKGKAGLRQFKSLYAPQWQPRYFAAPNALVGGLAALALAVGIQRPIARKVSRTHHLHAMFDIACAQRLRHVDALNNEKQINDLARQSPLPPVEKPRLAAG